MRRVGRGDTDDKSVPNDLSAWTDAVSPMGLTRPGAICADGASIPSDDLRMEKKREKKQKCGAVVH